MNILAGLGDALSGAVGEIKKFAGTRIGKVVLTAAAIYTGAAFLSGATSATGVLSYIAASPTAVGAAVGAIAGAATGKNENILAGAAIGGLAGYGYGAMTESAAPNLLTSTTPSTTGVPTSAGIDATLSNASGIESGINLGSTGLGSTGLGSTGLGSVPPMTPPTGAATSWAAQNPMLAYGAMQAGGSVIAGYAQGEAQKAADVEAAKRQQATIDAENARIASTQYRGGGAPRPLALNNISVAPQTLAPNPIALLPAVPTPGV